MRVVLNQLPACGQKTGIGHYTAELVRCLQEQIGDDEIYLYPRNWVQKARRMWAKVRPCFEESQTKTTAAPRQAAAARSTSLVRLRGTALRHLRGMGQSILARHFRTNLLASRYDLYHEPNFIPLPSVLPTVATLHDLSALLHPEWHPADRVAHFEKNFERGLAQCSHFFSISEFGRQEVIRTLNIAPERITRTYMGIRPGLGPMPPEAVQETLRRLGLPKQYLLYLGTIEPRKNVLTLLKIYCSLPAPLREQWPLLLVGGMGWKSTDVADYLHNEARHRGVLHMGYVADEHLPALYNGARALVYPSIYEGFGLPPIEMMACGGAVLASTAGALVETVGSKAHLLPPNDVDGWRQALQRVVTDKEWWLSLRQGAAEVARPFTWDQCAADTLRVYRRLCGEKDVQPLTPARAA